MYLLYFSIKRGQGYRTQSQSHDTCVCCVTGHTTQSHLLRGTSDLEIDLDSFFFLRIFVMDLLFNKPKRTTAFDAGALCTSAKSCGRSWGWTCTFLRLFIDVVAPFSTAGQGGDESSMRIPFPIKLYTSCVKQIPSSTAQENTKAWDKIWLVCFRKLLRICRGTL